MSQHRVVFPGVPWSVAWLCGVGVLVGLVMPWYRGSVTGNAEYLERGLGTVEGWCVAIAVMGAMIVGVISWLRPKKAPGVGLKAVALVLAGGAFVVAWIYGEQNADPVIVAGRRVEAGLGNGFYVSLICSGVMVLALAAGVVLGLVQKRQPPQRSSS